MVTEKSHPQDSYEKSRATDPHADYLGEGVGFATGVKRLWFRDQGNAATPNTQGLGFKASFERLKTRGAGHAPEQLSPTEKRRGALGVVAVALFGEKFVNTVAEKLAHAKLQKIEAEITAQHSPIDTLQQVMHEETYPKGSTLYVPTAHELTDRAAHEVARAMMNEPTIQTSVIRQPRHLDPTEPSASKSRHIPKHSAHEDDDTQLLTPVS